MARKIVEHEVTANLLAAYRFVDWFALGLDVPVILFQDGDGLAGMPDPGVAGIGDIRLVPRFRLLRVADGLFSLGAAAVLTGTGLVEADSLLLLGLIGLRRRRA